MVFVLERQAAEEGFHKFDFAVRQLKFGRSGIELQGVAGLAMLLKANTLVVLAGCILLVAIDALECFPVRSHHRIGEVLLMVKTKGVWIGNFFRDRPKFGMIPAKACDGSARFGRSFGKRFARQRDR